MAKWSKRNDGVANLMISCSEQSNLHIAGYERIGHTAMNVLMEIKKAEASFTI